MGYQVLARKWRPQSFQEMVGQEHVLRALINALDQERLHHAYLFTGTRGVGKTTIARILAKCLNCEVGVSSIPCGQCASCVEITEGRFIDLIEVDAASRTKVEDTREMLDNVQYAPTRGRYKVYLIDEVHMLSTHSFNALLKTLEEPPPHVKFLLATTDPQKLPATILSRCLQFSLKNMTPQKIVTHLQYILEQETVPAEDAALWLLGRAANGSIRDALSLTDQAISYGSGELQEQQVREMLGTIDSKMIYRIAEALVDKNAPGMLQAIDKLAEHAGDFESALDELNSLLHRVAIAQAVPGSLDNSLGDKKDIQAMAGRLAAEEVQLFYQIGLMGKRDIGLAPDPKSGFEMALLRMMAFKPQGVPEPPSKELPQQDQTEQGATQHSGTAVECLAEVADTIAGKEGAAPVKKPEAVAESAIPVSATPLAQSMSGPASAAATPSAVVGAVVETVAETVVGADVGSAVSIDAPAVLPTAAQVHSPAAAVAEAAVIEKQTVETAIQQTVQQAVQQTDTRPGQQTKVQPRMVEPQIISLEEVDAGDWIGLFPQLNLSGAVKNIASHCILTGVKGNHFEFDLEERQSTIYNDNHRRRFQDGMSQYFGADVVVEITVANVNSETPAQYIARRKAERLDQATQIILQDANVKLLIDEFDGALLDKSIVPLDEKS